MATKASIVIPTTKDNAPTVAETVATELASRYGGSTKTYGEGYYDNGMMLEGEDNITVYTISDDVTADELHEIGQWVKEELQEDSVMVMMEDVNVTFV